MDVTREFTSSSYGRVDAFNTVAHNADGSISSMTSGLDISNDATLDQSPVFGSSMRP